MILSVALVSFVFSCTFVAGDTPFQSCMKLKNRLLLFWVDAVHLAVVDEISEFSFECVNETFSLQFSVGVDEHLWDNAFVLLLE